MSFPNMKRGRAALWTRDRIDALATPELRELHANALRLNETELAALCDEILGLRPRGRIVERKAPRKHVRLGLVSRLAALGTRGVIPANRFWSRGGVRASDGMVVLVLWAEDARVDGSRTEFLLWAPNVDGARAWSDSAGGRERLEHCRKALASGAAEGLLGYGVRMEGMLPEEKVLHFDGADPENVLSIAVERRGDEYWGVWHRPAPQPARPAHAFG